MRATDPRLVVIFTTVLMTQLSIGALNDWADRPFDARAQRRKPLLIGRMSPNTALALALLFAGCALPGALIFGLSAGLVLATGLLAGWTYDLILKPTMLSVVPFALAFPLLPTWVGLIAGLRLSQFSSLMAAGALLAAAIHLGDSLPDLQMDARSGVRSLGVVLGPSGALRAMVLCTLAGGLITVVALRSRLLIAAIVGLACLATIGVIARLIPTNPAHARWIAAVFAIVASLALLSGLGHG